MQDLFELFRKTRSYRRFDESQAVPAVVLRELVELSRFCPSGANLQPLKFILSTDPATNQLIFSNLAWAGYLKQWPGPGPGERPTAYVVILHDQTISAECRWDDAIVAHSLVLGAAERGFGGCIIGSIKKDQLRSDLGIDPQYKIMLVVAFGKPAEKVQIEDLAAGGDHRYWRDQDDVHHVPKRMLDDLIVWSKG